MTMKKKSVTFIGIVASLVIVSTMIETFADPVSAVSQAENQTNSTGSGNSTNLGANNNNSSNNPTNSGSTTLPPSTSGY